MDAHAETPSSRQLNILAMCANGMSREEIGRELFLAPRTVREDLDRARGCLDARNVTHAVAICLTIGYLVVEDGRVAIAGIGELIGVMVHERQTQVIQRLAA